MINRKNVSPSKAAVVTKKVAAKSTTAPAKKSATLQPITWSPSMVDVAKMKPGANQYKIKTELGRERLRKSMEKFGNAGALILNADYTIIDGHSRHNEAVANNVKTIPALMPNRLLTPKEYNEMNAMYDFASAGGIDFDRLHSDLGKAEDFSREWNFAVPKELLDSMGKGGRVSGGTSVNKGTVEVTKSNTRIINIIMNPEQEAIILAAEAVCAKKFGTDNVTDTVMAALTYVSKLKK